MGFLLLFSELSDSCSVRCPFFLQAFENEASSDHSQPEDRWDRTGHLTGPLDLIFEITQCITEKAAALNTKVHLWGGVIQKVHLGGFYGENRKQGNCGTRQKDNVASENEESCYPALFFYSRTRNSIPSMCI